MRIGVNLLNFSRNQFGGAQQYLENLIELLAEREEHLKLFLFLANPRSDIFPDNHPKIKKIFIKEAHIPSAVHEVIHRFRIDLWFCPLHQSYVPGITIPTIATIHDVLHTSYPQFVPGGLNANNKYYEEYIPSFHAVITVSHFSKNEIIKHLHIPESKVYAIYLDVPKDFYKFPSERRMEKVKAKYHLPDSYALYPASYNPHKNHLNLLKAIVVLRDKYHKNISLVLTGYAHRKNRTYQSVINYIKANNLEDQVKVLGYIAPKHMPYLYYHARFLVFPSLYEGFGIPLAEAMKTKTPIVCSNGGSIPEIVGDAALQFNPHSPESIARKILKVLHADVQSELIRKGSLRAKAFSWENNARETFRLFQLILNK